MNAERHLIIFHVGPVQEFILTARRSRDLWFGSWLLSELSKSVAREIVRQNNGLGIECLIFPAPRDLGELSSDNFQSPNRVVAVVGQHPEELGKTVHKVLLERLRAIREEAYQEIDNNHFDRVTADRQVDDLLEFYWVACPVNGNYAQALRSAEALMAARKTTRDFMPVSWGSQVPKSSLDGQRESVIPKSACVVGEENLCKRYGLRTGERLCGVGLLKRYGRRKKGDSFLSTSHIAALPLLAKLKNREATEEYFKALKFLGITPDAFATSQKAHPVFGCHDGQLLYEERLKDYFSENGKEEQAKKALRTYLKKAFEGEKPIPYYALLQADGDYMGKVIDQLSRPNQHQKLSQKLSGIADKVKEHVAEHDGSLVYAGGDDVLAFLPLHTVLACARDLAETFRQELADFSYCLSEGGKEASPTLSVGIAVVHHLEPLSDSLSLARQAEKAAKGVAGKNALAVTVSKRSGVEQTVSGGWDEKFYERLEEFIRLHQQDAISDSAAFELRDLTLRLEGKETKKIKGNFQKIVQAEAMRMLKRKKTQQGQQSIASNVLHKLEAYIETKQLSISQLADELIMARLFAEAMKQAGVDR